MSQDELECSKNGLYDEKNNNSNKKTKQTRNFYAAHNQSAS